MNDELLALRAELKGHFEKAAEHQTKFGTVSEDLARKIDAVQKQADAIDAKLAAVGTAAEDEGESFEEQMKNDASVQRLLKDKIDIIGRCIQQITAAKELPPTFVVMHPNDWWDIRLTKDGFGRYILGDPQQGSLAGVGFGSLNPSQNLFGLAVVPTTNIAVGTFLVGSGSPIAAEIRDRMEMQIDISTEHSTFFTQNLIAIRAEKRLAIMGGLARNMHANVKARRITGTGGKDKTAVMGILERGNDDKHSRVRATVVPNRRKKAIQAEVRKHVQAGSALYTDALKSYDGLTEFEHGVVDHAVQYVDGKIHTNGMENFWSLLKRGIKGTYVSVEPFHLFRYLDEQTFRFNNRKATDGERFAIAVDFTVDMSIDGKSLRVYGGKNGGASFKAAVAAYWQSVNMLRFTRLSGHVRMNLTVERKQYGGFITEVNSVHEPGHEPVLHVPDGECQRWAHRRTVDVIEHAIAIIPGMLRPVKHPRQNDAPPDTQ